MALHLCEDLTANIAISHENNSQHPKKSAQMLYILHQSAQSVWQSQTLDIHSPTTIVFLPIVAMNRQPKAVGLSSSISPTIAAGLRQKDDSATAVGHSPAASSGSRANYRLFMRALSPQMSSSKLVCLKSSQLSTESSQLSRKSRLLFAGNGELLAKRSMTNQRAPETCLRRREETNR